MCRRKHRSRPSHSRFFAERLPRADAETPRSGSSSKAAASIRHVPARESPSLEPVALREQRVGDRSHFDEGPGACERETGVTERRARLLLENRRDSLGGAAAIVCLHLRRAKVVALRTKASLAAGDGPCIFLAGSDDPQ